MFRGDDVANSAYLDLSKLQMFYFTIVLVLVYGVSLGMLFFDTGSGGNSNPSPITLFPPLSASMVTLLGISQGGYLAYKSIPRQASGTC